MVGVNDVHLKVVVPKVMPVDHNEPVIKGISVARYGPHSAPVVLPPSIFLVELLNRLGCDFPATSVLFGLLARQADLGFVKASRRDLSNSLGGRVSQSHVGRALVTLESLGLLETNTHPNSTSRYRVNSDALRSLLAEPLAPTEVIPGLSPLPALERIFGADAQGDSLEPHKEGSING